MRDRLFKLVRRVHEGDDVPKLIQEMRRELGASILNFLPNGRTKAIIFRQGFTESIRHRCYQVKMQVAIQNADIEYQGTRFIVERVDYQKREVKQ